MGKQSRLKRKSTTDFDVSAKRTFSRLVLISNFRGCADGKERFSPVLIKKNKKKTEPSSLAQGFQQKLLGVLSFLSHFITCQKTHQGLFRERRRKPSSSTIHAHAAPPASVRTATTRDLPTGLKHRRRRATRAAAVFGLGSPSSSLPLFPCKGRARLPPCIVAVAQTANQSRAGDASHRRSRRRSPPDVAVDTHQQQDLSAREREKPFLLCDKLPPPRAKPATVDKVGHRCLRRNSLHHRRLQRCFPSSPFEGETWS
ncbi:uncharacterized protein LOC111242294 [Vigna radiata var. radiata]|uniref:Uncharacterized protein LOC111242294 n=1 Tax=Vigna radiata var. radiata TaxID=3916 RepID=A0A3Q0FDY2_VIGRR|nr:uncharacterized protein LOC111242294 [Vigna radiata var. radiata]